MTEQPAELDASALRRRLALALRGEAGSARAEDGLLLWYLGDRSAARDAFERAWEAGRVDAALPLWLLERDRPEAERVERALALMEGLSGQALRGFARVVVSRLWLGEGRSAAASAVAMKGLERDPRCAVTPPMRLEGGVEASRALMTWAREEEEPCVALHALCLAALHGEASELSVPCGFDLSWALGLWAVDHSTLDALDARALGDFADALDDSAEARAMRVLSLEALGRRAPLEAARGYRQLAEVGADELFAVARVRSQRGFVAGGSLGEASEVALIRADFCADERLAHTLMLLSALYDRGERPRRARKTLARLVRACVEGRFRDAERYVGLILRLLEVLTEETEGPGALRALYDDLEGWLQGTSADVDRRYERLLVQGEGALLMPRVQLLQQASSEARRWLLPAAFELALRRVSDDELEHHLEGISGGALSDFVTPLLGWLRGTSELAAELSWWGGSEHVTELEALCASGSERVCFVASVALAEHSIRRGMRDAARAQFERAASMALEGAEEALWRGWAARLERLSGREGLVEAIAEAADERRFLARLERAPSVLEAYRLAASAAHEEGDWERGAELLGEAACLTEEGWLRARLYARAARWLSERVGQRHRAADASRAAWRAEPEAGRLATYARRLAEARDYDALVLLLADEPEFEVSASLISSALDAWREEREASSSERLEALLRAQLERPEARRIGLRTRLHEALASLRLEAGRVTESRRGLLRVVQLEEDEALRALASLRLGRLEAEHFEDEEAAMAHLRRALVRPETRPEALEAMGGLYHSEERLEGLVDFLLGAAEEAGELAAEVDCMMAAAGLLEGRLGEGRRAASLVERVLARQPGREDALTLKARLHRAEGEVDAAREALNALVEGAEGRARGEHRRALSSMLAEEGDAEGALSMEVRAFGEDPLDAEGFQSLARRALELGCQVEFVRLHNMAIRAARGGRFGGVSLEALYARKAAVELVALERFRDAARSLIDALRLNPDEGSYLEDIEGIAQELGEPIWTARAWEARLEAWPPDHPRRAALHRRLAALYSDALEVPGRAAEHLLEARDRAEDAADREALVEPIEALLERAGDPRRLRAWLERRLAELAPEDPARASLLERLARALESLGDEAGAIARYEALAAHAPERVAPGAEAFTALSRLYERGERLRDLVSLVLLEASETPAARRCPVLLRLGGLYGRLGEVERASRCYQAALALTPESEEALEGVSRALEQLGDWEGLMVLLEDASQHRESPRMLMRMARVALEHLEEPERAAGLLERAAEMGSEEAREARLELAVQRGEWERASELLEDAVGEAGPETGYWRALVARGLGRPGQALRELEAVLTETPSHRGAWRVWRELAEAAPERCSRESLGFLDHHLARLPKGDAELRSAVSCTRARLAEARGDIDGALTALTRALGEHPGGEALREAARLRLRLGEVEAAEQLWEAEARRFDAGSAGWAQASLEAARVLLDWRGDGEAARAALEAIEASEVGPALWPETGFMRAQAWALCGRFERASEVMRRVLEGFEMSTAARLDEAERVRVAHHHFYLGRMLAACGEHDEAASCFAVALALDPEHPSTRLAALQNLLTRGDWEHFDGQCRAAASRLEGGALARLRWLEAEAASRRGDRERRRRALRAVVRL